MLTFSPRLTGPILNFDRQPEAVIIEVKLSSNPWQVHEVKYLPPLQSHRISQGPSYLFLHEGMYLNLGICMVKPLLYNLSNLSYDQKSGP